MNKSLTNYISEKLIINKNFKISYSDIDTKLDNIWDRLSNGAEKWTSDFSLKDAVEKLVDNMWTKPENKPTRDRVFSNICDSCKDIECFNTIFKKGTYKQALLKFKLWDHDYSRDEKYTLQKDITAICDNILTEKEWTVYDIYNGMSGYTTKICESKNFILFYMKNEITGLLSELIIIEL